MHLHIKSQNIACVMKFILLISSYKLVENRTKHFIIKSILNL